MSRSILSGLRKTILPLLLSGSAMAYPPATEDSTAINVMLNDLCNKAVAHNTSGFLSHFSTNYLHNGTDYVSWSSDVSGGLPFVSACSFNNRSIDMIDATTAKVSGMLEITVDGETTRTPQPDYNQDNPGVGWLKKEGSSWKIIGNRFRATWNGVFTGNNLTHGNRFLRVRVENENSAVTSASVNGSGIANTVLSADPDLGGNVAFVSPSTPPAVGTIYTIQASYQDGTSDTIPFPIQSWVNVAPSINVTGGSNQMTISWNDVSSDVPLASHYRVTVSGNGVFWAMDDISLDTLAVKFNQDNSASGTLGSGQTYSVEVMIFDAYDNYAYRVATHTQSVSAPPANDTFVFATDFGSSATASSNGDWTNATSEASIGEPDLEENESFSGWPVTEDATLWYKWTAPAGITWAQVKINSVVNVVNSLAVYTGDSINSLSQLRLNQREMRYYTRVGDHLDMAPNRVTFPVTPGQIYYIRPSIGLSRFDEMEMAEIPDYSFSVQLTSITTPTTADQYVLRGRGKLESGSKADVASAKDDFQQAFTQISTHAEARFLFALAQLLSLENETGFTTLLGQLGIPNSGSFRTTGYQIPTDLTDNPVFASGANSSQLIDWLKNSVLPRLAAVRTSLSSITDTNFTTDLTRSESGIEDVAIDLADAKMLKATSNGLDLIVHLLTTYNLAMPLRDLVTLDTTGQLDAEHVLASYQNLLKFSDTDRRLDMANAVIALRNDYLDASNAVTSLRNTAPYAAAGTVCENLDSVQDADIRTDLSTAVNGLTQQVSIGGHPYHFSNFLNTTASLRDWLPSLRGNDAFSAVPDPTFSGIAPSATASDVEGGLYEIGRLYGMSQYANGVGGYLEWLGLDDRPNDDADHDGKSNFSEWIFASDPVNAEESGVQARVSRVAATPGQPDEIQFSFLRSIDLYDWELFVEVSEDMAQWDTSGTKVAFVSAVPTGDGYSEIATYRLVSPSTPPSHQFFRAVARPRVNALPSLPTNP